MRPPLPRQKAPERQRRADDDRLVQHEKNVDAADKGRDRSRDLEAQQESAAELGFGGRADREEQAEEKRQGEKREANRPGRATGEKPDPAAIKKGRRARPHRRQLEKAREVLRRAPERRGGIDQRGEDEDGEEVDGRIGKPNGRPDARGRAAAAGPRPPRARRTPHGRRRVRLRRPPWPRERRRWRRVRNCEVWFSFRRTIPTSLSFAFKCSARKKTSPKSRRRALASLPHMQAKVEAEGRFSQQRAPSHKVRNRL